jgi:predicted acyltransferase
MLNDGFNPKCHKGQEISMNIRSLERALSVDAFRGIAIAGMILVNNPGSWEHVYTALRHAEWHGWTPTDLIFPFFLFITGMSIKFSLDNSLRRGRSRSDISFRILSRSLKLFILGLVLNGFDRFDLTTLRIPGVLQRIAVCYLIVSLFYLSQVLMTGGKLYFSPVWMLGIGLGLLALYTGLVEFVPVPGHGAGLWDSKEWNLASYIDRSVFGRHVWSQSREWGDPEGLLSTLPAVVTTITGVVCAWWIRLQHQNHLQRISMLFVAGAGGVLLGYGLGFFIPINKNLWTPSFVFLTSGIASMVLGICVWMADIRRWTFLMSPFISLGSNSISVFFLSSVAGQLLAPQKEALFEAWSPALGMNQASLAIAILYVLFWILIASILYKRRIYLRV